MNLRSLLSTFLTDFVGGVLAAVFYVSSLVSLILLPRQWAIPLCILLVFAGAFIAVRRTRLRCEKEIGHLNGVIAKLKVRPYDLAHRLLAQERIAPLGPDERDLIRHLLHFGETEQARLCAASRMEEANFARTLDSVARTQLVERAERQKLGRAGIDSYWRVNPEFAEVLSDLLFPREEAEPQLHFAQ